MNATNSNLYPKNNSQSRAFYPHFYCDPILLSSIAYLILITLIAVFAPYISKFILHNSPTDQNITNKFLPWFNWEHLLGTDELGRDVLTRAIFASRISLSIGFGVVFFETILGVTLGLCAGYYGHLMDDIGNAIFVIVKGIPLFFLLIILAILFRPSIFGIIGILAIFGWTSVYRQVRGLVLSIKQQEYIEAARALGASDGYIFIFHFLPNISSIIFLNASLDIAATIITESSLSFLGFGVQAPIASWGNMLSGAVDNILVAPWLIITPGILITLTVFSVFVVSDGIRDALDPNIKNFIP